MIAAFMVLLGGAFFIGVGVGCWCHWDNRKQFLDTIANAKDERDAARDVSEYWRREYQILVRSVQMMRQGEGDWWKDDYGD